MSSPNPYKNAVFALASPDLAHCPEDSLGEVAFAGRSNAGKSSAINTLTGNKKLARTSKTPGRTQLINYFSINCAGYDCQYLVDLPGYGFAAAPKAVKVQWVELIERYFANRDELAAVVLIVDVRRGLTDLDQQLLSWVGQRFLPVHVLLTKADKLSRNAAKQTLFKIERELTALNPLYTAQLFSSTAREGVDQARDRISELLRGQVAPS